MGLIICVLVGCERFTLIITGPTKLAVFNGDFRFVFISCQRGVGSYVWLEIKFKIENLDLGHSCFHFHVVWDIFATKVRVKI